VDQFGSTERLIQQLSESAEPVRRVPPLWLGFAFVIAIASAIGGLFLLAAGAVDGLTAHVLRGGSPGFLLLGLAIAGLSGSVAALAEGLPGRERVAYLCGGLAVVAYFGGAGRALVAWWSEGFALGDGLVVDRVCLQTALELSLVPILALTILLARGWVGRPARAAALALAAGAATGSLVVHLGCPITEARHLLIGHASAVVASVAVFAAPLAFWLRRRAR
jgi:hypothetical protein